MNIDLDPRRMFPQAARRADILEELQRSWHKFVGPALAKHSRPYNLGVNYLCIAAASEMAKDMLTQQKGSIARRMAKLLNYETGPDFELRITASIPKEAPKPVKSPSRISAITVDEERVRQLMEGAPPTLPEDINHALASLWAFTEQLHSSHKVPPRRLPPQ